jgi:hypothetical protein
MNLLFVSHQVSGDLTTSLGIALGAHAGYSRQCDNTQNKKKNNTFHV